MHRLLLLTALLLIFLASGCGIKPGTIEPPPGSEDKEFPRTYPDPSTDPSFRFPD